MQNLFNYTTLSTRLEKTTRTLFVTLNRPDWKNALRLEMLFELESLFAWCTSRVEINSIFIDSSTSFFSTGLDDKNLPQTSADQLEKINTKLQKLIFAMMQLPQTILMDLGEGSETLASEFSLGADIRIASSGASIKFNHNQFGLIPAAGGMSTLSTLISPSLARNWVLTGSAIQKNVLLESGFLSSFYDSTNRLELIQDLLKTLSESAPVQRIQSKLGLFEALRPQLESALLRDRKIAKASRVSEDWKGKKRKKQKDQDDFMPAKSMSYAVKLSLIKSEENLSH